MLQALYTAYSIFTNVGGEDDVEAGSVVCVNEKYTTSVKGVTNDFVKMTGLKCCVWKYSVCDQNALFHCIPKQAEKRTVSLKALNLSEVDIKSNTRVCSVHFPGGDASKPP